MTNEQKAQVQLLVVLWKLVHGKVRGEWEELAFWIEPAAPSEHAELVQVVYENGWVRLVRTEI
jgi:hypothetical protein